MGHPAGHLIMKNRRLVSALIYGTSAFCLFLYFDSLNHTDAPSYQVRLLLVAAVLFGIAVLLSLFARRAGAICALVAAVICWPLLWRLLGMTATQFGWLLNYHPNTPATVISLIVATLRALTDVFPLIPNGTKQTEPDSRAWTLTVTALYMFAMVLLECWQAIWEWLFKLRYGS